MGRVSRIAKGTAKRGATATGRTAKRGAAATGRSVGRLAKRTMAAGYKAGSTEHCPHCGGVSAKAQRVCPHCERAKH
jgi:hypothetical protein